MLFRLDGGRQIPDLAAWQFLDSYVAELDAGAVSEQSDVSRGVEQPRVVAVIDRIGVLLAAVGRHVVPLAGFADVAVEDHLAVDRHRDPVAHGADLLDVPGAQRREFHPFGRDDAVDRSCLLYTSPSPRDTR